MAEKLSSVETVSSDNPASFLKVLYKNLILIVLITVLCGLCGVLYSIINVKPVYKASRSVILRTAVDINEEGTTASTDATLAKIYLPDVEKALKAPNVIKYANELYNVEGEKLSSGRVSVNYGSDSLIFSISYTDLDGEKAEAKLNALIDAGAERLKGLIEAKDVTLISVQENADISVSNAFNKYIVFGVFIGVAISFAIVLIRYALDNTVKSKTEYEYLTGVNVIAVIDKVDDKKSKRK
ncbi:MAG: hypothetical protein IJB32_01130 [Clostridia bacterium]|nr:hypothetical protein [Clostridia bacterium]